MRDIAGSPVATIVGITTLILAACTSSGATSGPGSSLPSGSRTAPPGATSSGIGSIDLSSLRGRIAFSAGTPLHEDVYVIDASGKQLTRVTRDPAADFDPTWSPDGAQIAYRHQAGPYTTQTDIFVTAADGGEPTDLTMSRGVSDWGPAWSSDGSLIAWNSMRDAPRSGVLHGFVMHPDGSGIRRITDEIWVEYPAWSPDGTMVAFMAQEPGTSGFDPDYNIYVMNADGSGVIKLTDGPGTEGFPAWSPDGTQIAFSSTQDDCSNSDDPGCLSTGDIGPFYAPFVMNADGSGQMRLTDTFAQSMDWSPDGRFIVFNGRDGLNVISADGSAFTTIPIALQDPSFPDWIA
jgi:Tol biopolymer transport system component